MGIEDIIGFAIDSNGSGFHPYHVKCMQKETYAYVKSLFSKHIARETLIA